MTAVVATDLRKRVEALKERIPGFNWEALRAHTSLGSSNIRNWWVGVNQETDAFRRELEPVVRRLERGEITLATVPGIALDDVVDVPEPRRVKKQGRHYDITVTRRIHAVLDYCWTESALGVVTVEYGGGKTHAVRSWRAAHPKVNAVVLEFREFLTGNKCWFIQKLADVLDVRAGRGGTTGGGRLFDAVVDHLREKPTLLIFDQCEAIRVPVAQVIRQLWDATRDDGTGIVLLGAHRLYERLRASRAQDLGALTSRVCPWAVLAGVTRGEMEQILKHEGISNVAPKAMEMLWLMVNGSMRMLMHMVDLIQAKHKSGAVTEVVVAEMAAFLCGAPRRA